MNLLIANILSFVTACFTVASSFTKDPHRTYWYQVGQCIFYAAANYFFGVPAAIVTMVISAFRNALVASGHYSVRWMVLSAAATLTAGLWVNGGSIPGYISVFMTVFYTFSSYYLKDAKAVKINVAIDLCMWFIFDLCVCDISDGIVDFISTVLAVVTFVRICRDEKRASAG